MLPDDLVRRLHQAAASQAVQPEKLLRTIETMVGDDAIDGFSIWEGPGFAEPDLLLDCFILGEAALYSYSARSSMDSSACIFLDDLTMIGIISTGDEMAPHVLHLHVHREIARIYGKDDGLQALEAFRRDIIKASSRARSRRGI